MGPVFRELLCKQNWGKKIPILVVIRKRDWKKARLEMGRPVRELLLIFNRKVVVT